VPIPRWFLQVETQPEVGNAAYDAGARQLCEFFDRHLAGYLACADLEPLGRRIIETCLGRGAIGDYDRLLPRH
jgi:hypothetical protein